MNATERRGRLREMLAGDRIVYPASIWDAISAQLAEMVGYELLFVAGPTGAAAILGVPNHYLNLLTATEVAEQDRRICRAVRVPVLVVAENGYGNAMNVMRTVEDLECAGVGGLTLDDPVQPFRFGGPQTDFGYETWEKPWEICSIEESVGKLKAALRARQDPSLVVVARTRALGAADQQLDQVTTRLKAFEKAGADALMVGDIHTRTELEAVGSATRLPIVLNSASSLRLVDEGITDDDVLRANGFRIRISPPYPFWNSVTSAYETLKAMHGTVRDGKVPAEVRRVDTEAKERFLRQSRYTEWTKEFMS